MKDHRKHRVPTARHRKVAAELSAGKGSIYKIMLANGYTEWTARMGLAGVPKTVLALMPKESNLVELGSIDANLQEKIVRGRLVANTLMGKDSGVMSAKQLGSDKRIAMFAPDSVTGVVVVNAPGQDAVDKLLNPAESDTDK